MSFGRPVLPPDVGALNDVAIAGGNGAEDTDRFGSKPPGSVGRPRASAGSTPTTSEGLASSTIARRSADGNREEIGCGVAPSFHAATADSKNPIPFGSPMVTRESGVTP